MRILCGLLIPGCLFFLSANTCFAIGRETAEILPFDRYGRISYEEEAKRLEAFAAQLKKQPQMIGYIYVREGQISCGGYAVSHAINAAKYLIQAYELPWNRVAWRDLGYGNSFEVSLWLFPAGKPPLYDPPYQPDAMLVEDCSMMARQSGRKKVRDSRRSAKKRLERTRGE